MSNEIEINAARYVDSLVMASTSVEAAAGDKTSEDYSVPADRGDVYAVEVIPETGNYADLENATFSIVVNSVTYYEQVRLSRFFKDYQGTPKVVTLPAREQAKIKLTVENESGSTYHVGFNFFFKPKKAQR